jgi:hypothetical protein
MVVCKEWCIIVLDFFDVYGAKNGAYLICSVQLASVHF